MSETPKQNEDVVTPSPRKPWVAPQLLSYGHIGKLTQGMSGTKADGTTSKRNACL